MFCNTTLSIPSLKTFLTKKAFKQLLNDEFEAMFMVEQNQLERSINNLYRQFLIAQSEVIKGILILEGYTDDEIENIMSEMMLAPPPQHSSVQCPSCGENMKGDDTIKTCSECSVSLCSKCLDDVGEELHQCCKEKIDTINQIKKTCHPCPMCRTMIEKDGGGCDQMFCTRCNTTFSWATGQVVEEDDVRHNPHFFEWRRRTNQAQRQDGDDGCEGQFNLKCQENEELSHFITLHTLVNTAILNMLEFKEREAFIREGFRLQHYCEEITLKQWRKHFKDHITTTRRNNDMVKLLRLFIEGLHFIVMNDGETDHLFDMTNEALRDLQKEHGKETEYSISSVHVSLPYLKQK